MGRLNGKVVLMTGGARGIGAEGARALAREGASVMIGDILDEAGEQSAAEIRDAGGQAAFIHHDTTAPESWSQAIKQTEETFGGLDVLVNNAGIEILKTLAETSLEDLRRISAVNEHGVYMGIKYAVEPMTRRGGGSIINLSSLAGLQGAFGLTAYCMTKGAVRLLTKAAAVELARSETNIRVNSVHPGVIETKMIERLFEGYADIGVTESATASEEMFVQRTPLGRLGQPMDVANGLVFLASDESSFITGTELVIDGGIFSAV